MLTNSALPSGVSHMPVISQPTGPTRKRFSVSAVGALPT
jgi:hypothetical protein